MTDILDLNVEKTLKQIPRNDVKEIICICVMDDDSIKAYTTLEDNSDVADALMDAVFLYEPELFEVEV